ncbi:hypothetical protein WMF28_03720 [Sorangium sp. So ce590]|uniref:hypothetical protein n=1 Tax=Sorangium sp. So ce590 TaxID=3133317 RepID=UPI003F5EAE2A
MSTSAPSMPYRNSTTSGLVQCPCGHGRDHHMVSAEAEYRFLGYIQLAFGISARPTKVKYRCRRCDTVFSTTTDPAVLDKHY